jgi:hypothetical protein
MISDTLNKLQIVLGFLLYLGLIVVRSTVTEFLFLTILIVAGFSLPFLIAKVSFKSRILSITSVLCFLLYPLIFGVAKSISLLFGIDIGILNSISSLLTLLLFHVYLYAFIRSQSDASLLKYIDTLITVSVICVIFFAVVFILRDFQSVISTDLLVHKTAVNGMNEASKFYLFPDGYSNVFTERAYPVVIYHTFIHTLSEGFQITFANFAFLIDIIFSIFGAIVAFVLLKSITKRDFLATIGLIICLFSFENLAYTFHVFIPQTFAFFLFMISLGSIIRREYTFLSIAALITIMLLTHFYIGGFLVFLILLSLLYEKLNLVFLREGFLSLTFIFVLFLFGFSFAQEFQSEYLEYLGMIDIYPPNSTETLKGLFNTLGLVLVLVPLAIASAILSKKIKTYEILSLYGIITGIGMYLLLPVFSGKFLIGLGFFAAIIIAKYVQKFNIRNNFIMFIIFILILIPLILNFYTSYQKSLPFLEQRDGTYTALSPEDISITNYWLNNKPNCIVVSDPQTQITLHSIGKGNSAGGLYMSIESRRKLNNFVENPTEDGLLDVRNIHELLMANVDQICFVMSSRLRHMVENDSIWTSSVLNYTVKQGEEIVGVDSVMEFMEKDYKEIYSDDFFTVYLLP